MLLITNDNYHINKELQIYNLKNPDNRFSCSASTNLIKAIFLAAISLITTPIMTVGRSTHYLLQGRFSKAATEIKIGAEDMVKCLLLIPIGIITLIFQRTLSSRFTGFDVLPKENLATYFSLTSASGALRELRACEQFLADFSRTQTIELPSSSMRATINSKKWVEDYLDQPTQCSTSYPDKGYKQLEMTLKILDEFYSSNKPKVFKALELLCQSHPMLYASDFIQTTMEISEETQAGREKLPLEQLVFKLEITSLGLLISGTYKVGLEANRHNPERIHTFETHVYLDQEQVLYRHIVI